MHKSGNITVFVEGEPIGRITGERFSYLLKQRGADANQMTVALHALISGAPVRFNEVYAYVEYGNAKITGESVDLAKNDDLKEGDWVTIQYDTTVIKRTSGKLSDVSAGTEFVVCKVESNHFFGETSAYGIRGYQKIPIAVVTPCKEVELHDDF